MTDQPCLWGFAFNSVRTDSVAGIGLRVDYR